MVPRKSFSGKCPRDLHVCYNTEPTTNPGAFRLSRTRPPMMARNLPTDPAQPRALQTVSRHVRTIQQTSSRKDEIKHWRCEFGVRNKKVSAYNIEPRRHRDLLGCCSLTFNTTRCPIPAVMLRCYGCVKYYTSKHRLNSMTKGAYK